MWAEDEGGVPESVSATVQYGPSVLARALYLHDYQLLPYARTTEAMKELFGCAMSAGNARDRRQAMRRRAG
jgi:transposase